ncbi:OmpH family outer membrane protein [Bacteriovoracaceae bacterium]|nr:OmpH family outer membrane protein [Bacteriovoracaceae bacterium]
MKKMMLVVALMMVSNFAFSKVTVGIINIQKIIATVKEGKSADKKLKKSYNDKKKRLETEKKSIVDLQKKLEKQSLVMSAKAKNKKMMELQAKMKAFQEKMMAADKDIKKQQDQLKRPILEKLKTIIEGISKNEGVDITVELSSSPLVYAANKIDLTQKVITEYDKKHSK